MTGNKPEAEVAINHDLIETLLNEFVPEFANEPLEFHDAGWDNEIHRLGTDHAVRLPRREMAAELVRNEQRWLPELAPTLPLPIPAPVHAGKPAFGFPWNWSIVPWHPGVPLVHAPPLDTDVLMEQMSGFLNALHVPAPDDAPSNPYRGTPLSERTELVSARISEIADTLRSTGFDPDAVLAVWETLAETPEWGGAPLWLHGDLHPLNLLVRGGRISAVIDFGDITAGDPATDLSVAWMLFETNDARNNFRKQSTIDGRSVDIHTWNRARAWALSHATGVLANAGDTPDLRRMSITTLTHVMGS